MKEHERKPPENGEPELHQPEDAVQDLEPDQDETADVRGGLLGNLNQTSYLK